MNNKDYKIENVWKIHFTEKEVFIFYKMDISVIRQILSNKQQFSCKMLLQLSVGLSNFYH